MDTNTSSILSIFAFIVSSGGVIYTAINHKRIRCRCCGKNMDASVDVDSTETQPTAIAERPRRVAPEEEEEDAENGA